MLCLLRFSSVYRHLGGVLTEIPAVNYTVDYRNASEEDNLFNETFLNNRKQPLLLWYAIRDQCSACAVRLFVYQEK